MTRNTMSGAAVKGGHPEPTSKTLLDKWTFINKLNGDHDLSASAKVVAVTLMWHMNCRYQSCFPKQSSVAFETGLSARTVVSAVQELRDRGWLTWEKREKGGNAYRFVWGRADHVRLPGERQEPEASADFAHAETPTPSANSAPEACANSASLYEHGKDITREALPSSSASPQKTAQKSPKPCPSADHQPPQEGTAEWYKIEVWNVVGVRFKERFYPTVSMAAFKKRLGHEIKRLDNDLRKVRLAMLETMRAEPGLDAWEYFCGVARQQPKDSQPRMRGTI